MTSKPVHQSTTTAAIGAALDMTERFPVTPTRNIRRPITAKHAFSRTAAVAAREDGVDTTVTVTRPEPGTPIPAARLRHLARMAEKRGEMYVRLG